MTNELEKPIGTIESSKLNPNTCIVQSVAVEGVTKKTGEAVGRKVKLTVTHPESQEPLDLSSVQYLKNKAVKQSALWYNEDKEGNIAKNSALAEAMRYYKVATLKQFEGKAIEAIVDEKGYLTIKAY
jgi:hypothetical protein